MKTPRLLVISLVVVLALSLVNAILVMAKFSGSNTAPSQEADIEGEPSPDLNLSEFTVQTKVEAGERITYMISLLNTGSPAEASVLTNVLPLGTSYISGSLTCSSGNCAFDANSRSILWNGNLPSMNITKTRYYVTAYNDLNLVYVIDLIKAGWWEPNSWGIVKTFTLTGIIDTWGIDYDAEHQILYHSDFSSDMIVVTDLSGNYLNGFPCHSPAGYNSGVTYIEGSNPPEVWVTDFSSNKTTRCEASILPSSQSIGLLTPGDIIETFTNTWGTSAFGLVYNPIENLIRYAHEGYATNSAEIWDIDFPTPHLPLFNISLSTVNPGWPVELDNHNGIDFDFNTDTYLLSDFNGDPNTIFNDNLIEIIPDGTILNSWELDGAGNDSYDGSNINQVIDIAIVPSERVLISFAVQVDAAYAEIIANTANLYDPMMTFPISFSVSTEIVDSLYNHWDFEANDGGFAPTANDDWQWGVPSRGYASGPQNARSGVKVWGTNLSGEINVVISHTLTISSFLPTDPNGLYLQWWDWKGSENPITRSVLVNGIEIWNDGGIHQPNWQSHTLNMTAYSGTLSTIQFHLNTCCSPPNPAGWYMDDVAIHSKLAPPDVSVTGDPVSISLPPGKIGTVPIQIENNGGLGVIWSLSESTDDIPWLNETPINGIVGKASTQTIELFFDSMGLSLGTFTETITIHTNDEDTPNIFVNVTLNVIEHKLYIPIIFK